MIHIEEHYWYKLTAVLYFWVSRGTKMIENIINLALLLPTDPFKSYLKNVWTRIDVQIFCLHWVGLTITGVDKVSLWWVSMRWLHTGSDSRPQSQWESAPDRKYPRLRGVEARIPSWRLPSGDTCIETRLMCGMIDKSGNNILTRKALQSAQTKGHFSNITQPGIGVTPSLSLEMMDISQRQSEATYSTYVHQRLKFAWPSRRLKKTAVWNWQMINMDKC